MEEQKRRSWEGHNVRPYLRPQEVRWVMVVTVVTPGTGEAEVGRSLRVPGQPMLHSETLTQKQFLSLDGGQ